MIQEAYNEGQQDALHRKPMAVSKDTNGKYTWLQDEGWAYDRLPESSEWSDSYIIGYKSIF